MSRYMIRETIYALTGSAAIAQREGAIIADALAVTTTREMALAIWDAFLERNRDAIDARTKQRLMDAWAQISAMQEVGR